MVICLGSRRQVTSSFVDQPCPCLCICTRPHLNIVVAPHTHPSYTAYSSLCDRPLAIFENIFHVHYQHVRDNQPHIYQHTIPNYISYDPGGALAYIINQVSLNSSSSQSTDVRSNPSPYALNLLVPHNSTRHIPVTIHETATVLTAISRA